MKKCLVETCDREQKSKGYCARHYQNLWKVGNPLGATRRNERGAATRHPLYGTWSGMIRRCEDTLDRSFERYGGRGIAVCERWHDFWNFADDMGQKPSANHSLDRIDVDGGYEPSNVRWATQHTQTWNRRCSRLTEQDRVQVMELYRSGVNKRQVAKRLGLEEEAVRRYINRETYVEREKPFVPAKTVTEEELKFRPVRTQKCSLDGCGSVVSADGLCRRHWRWKHESKTLADVGEIPAARPCRNCEQPLPARARIDTLFCSLSCKMKFHRREGSYSHVNLAANREPCSIEGCSRPSHAQGICRTHYMRQWHAKQKTGDPA